ncbi:uncharacterized protein Dwil_GK21603 [Drosophila willistoni]|uniref:NADP-dependent malic enzyme isoform X1 n=1 Tax=Drosophila willistoni TaxID=7260 RepID=UPI0007328B36|nr:NADP-dependent malic enzyme isoform X1 [Drosophila willistoni]EDW74004.2 uncharacterized protein Dwil_GK21603 [Drosophila willistoni]
MNMNMKCIKASKLLGLRSFMKFLRFSHENVVRPEMHVVTGESFNKGLAFTMEERQILGVHGLWPCSYRTIHDQLYAVMANFNARSDNIGRFTYLLSLSRRHQRLFFRFLREHLEKVMPIVYTPTVADVVNAYGLLFRDPTGLYVTIFDRGHIIDVLKNWRAEKQVRAVCVSDGGRVLGLGDMGASSMGICVGKMALYTALGGVPPNQLLPIALDVGTDNEELLNDPLYVGARTKRVQGDEYEEFVQEFVDAVLECFGPNTCIHFEDFATPNAFKFLEKYQRSFCCFNDDIQGTGAMSLAGFFNVERVVQRKLEDHVFLFAGIGSACLGIANMLLSELKRRGLKQKDACQNIYMINEHGLLNDALPGCVNEARKFAKPLDCVKLDEAVEQLKPSILVGGSSVRGLFTEEVLRLMAKYNERPVIFALSNPTNKAECTAEQAYQYTEGRAIFCGGSPFPPVTYNGKRLQPGQANNCLIYPGLALGAISARASYLPNEVFSVAASTIAKFTSEENLNSGNMYPSMRDANEVSFHVGVSVAEYLIENDISNLRPLPENICEYMKNRQYSLDYGKSLPETWTFPHFPVSYQK